MKRWTWSVVVAAVSTCMPGGTTFAETEPIVGRRNAVEVVPVAAPRRPTVRRYRSYSIQPNTAAVPGGTIESPVTESPQYAPAPRSGGSKPSYTRADSKARGRFGQY